MRLDFDCAAIMNTTTVASAFSEHQAARLADVRIGQLRYWDSTGLLRPSFSGGELRDVLGRAYSFRDIVALRVIGALKNRFNVSTQHLREVKQKLVDGEGREWSGVRLFVLDKRVIWVMPGDEVPVDAASGQTLIDAIDIGDEVAEAQRVLQDMRRRRDDQVGTVSKNRKIAHNAAVIGGTRIPVRAIQRFHAAGYSPEAIIREYPDITERDVEAALALARAA